MKKEILTPQKTDYDIETPYERDVRPRKLLITSSEKSQNGLKIFIEAASIEVITLTITSLWPPWCRKTPCLVIAHELNVSIKITSGLFWRKLETLLLSSQILRKEKCCFIMKYIAQSICRRIALPALRI